MKKLSAWQKALIAIIIIAIIIAVAGPTKLNLGLLFLYSVMLPILYLLEKRNKLSLWQERIAFALMVYPIVYLIIPASDILNFFIASLLFSAILLLSEKWKDTEKEILPEWEGEESEKYQKTKETAENKTL